MPTSTSSTATTTTRALEGSGDAGDARAAGAGRRRGSTWPRQLPTPHSQDGGAGHAGEPRQRDHLGDVGARRRRSARAPSRTTTWSTPSGLAARRASSSNQVGGVAVTARVIGRSRRPLKRSTPPSDRAQSRSTTLPARRRRAAPAGRAPGASAGPRASPSTSGSRGRARARPRARPRPRAAASATASPSAKRREQVDVGAGLVGEQDVAAGVHRREREGRATNQPSSTAMPAAPAADEPRRAAHRSTATPSDERAQTPHGTVTEPIVLVERHDTDADEPEDDAAREQRREDGQHGRRVTRARAEPTGAAPRRSQPGVGDVRTGHAGAPGARPGCAVPVRRSSRAGRPGRATDRRRPRRGCR